MCVVLHVLVALHFDILYTTYNLIEMHSIRLCVHLECDDDGDVSGNSDDNKNNATKKQHEHYMRRLCIIWNCTNSFLVSRSFNILYLYRLMIISFRLFSYDYYCG